MHFYLSHFFFTSCQRDKLIERQYKLRSYYIYFIVLNFIIWFSRRTCFVIYTRLVNFIRELLLENIFEYSLFCYLLLSFVAWTWYSRLVKMAIAMAVVANGRQLWPTTMNKALCCEYTVESTRTEINWSRSKKKKKRVKKKKN